MRLSVKNRLTVIYSAMFLLMAAALVGVIYLQVAKTIEERFPGEGIAIRIASKAAPMAEAAPTAALRQWDATQAQAFKEQINKIVADEKAEALNQLIQGSLIIFLIFAVVSVVVGHFVAGRMLRPLQKMTATAQRLSHSTLHERIALDGPNDEIKDLADTFDAMLDRLHRAFDAQRRFVANASHELRTPLTINRTVLEVALAKKTAPEETKVLAGTLLATTDRHERLVEGLLLLARSENEPQERTPVDVAELTAAALDDLRADDLKVHSTLSPAPTAGEPVLLERCVANLLENAARYNVPDGEIWINTWHESGRAVVRVENTGPHVPTHALETIYEPFRRLRPDRTSSQKGTGLGLSIVRSVVRAHGGTIETRPRPDGGLVITLRLPTGRS